MAFFLTKLNRNGAITIPAELRQEMGIQNGTRISLEREGDSIILRPTPAFIRELRGSTRGAGAVREREHRKDKM